MSRTDAHVPLRVAFPELNNPPHDDPDLPLCECVECNPPYYGRNGAGRHSPASCGCTACTGQVVRAKVARRKERYGARQQVIQQLLDSDIDMWPRRIS